MEPTVIKLADGRFRVDFPPKKRVRFGVWTQDSKWQKKIYKTERGMLAALAREGGIAREAL